MSIADPADTAVSVYFEVHIDGYELGAFTGCDGLGCEIVIEPREEGGQNSYVHQLPGRIKYTNVKLTRPVTIETTKIAAWFAMMNGIVRRTRAEIIVKNHDNNAVFAGLDLCDPGALDRTVAVGGITEDRHRDAGARPPRVPPERGGLTWPSPSAPRWPGRGSSSASLSPTARTASRRAPSRST